VATRFRLYDGEQHDADDEEQSRAKAKELGPVELGRLLDPSDSDHELAAVASLDTGSHAGRFRAPNFAVLSDPI